MDRKPRNFTASPGTGEPAPVEPRGVDATSIEHTLEQAREANLEIAALPEKRAAGDPRAQRSRSSGIP
jgi:hypothetical protein